nr:MAG TPA: zinc-ribbon family protein [Caudoviricetes sp.]
MAFEDTIRNMKKRLQGNVCPNCGIPWKSAPSCPNCKYSPKIVACPKCATIKACISISEKRKLLTNPEAVDSAESCECNVCYAELNMTNEEYDKIKWDNLKVETWWPAKWKASACTLSDFVAARYAFENYFDKSQLDTSLSKYKSNYANMFPESEESIEYFRSVGGIENYYFPQNTGNVATRPKHVPKCPICGSENLTRLTTMKKAAKIALVGIYGLGDCGKTWKCNNCGSKF